MDGARPYLKLEDLQARGLPPSMERFLYNLALAENMV
jgi:hypothetical protein